MDKSTFMEDCYTLAVKLLPPGTLFFDFDADGGCKIGVAIEMVVTHRFGVKAPVSATPREVIGQLKQLIDEKTNG